MKRGFTLIEIMIVIAIIAMLAAMIVPNVLNAKKKQDTKYKSRMDDTEEVSHQMGTPHADHYNSKSTTDDYDLQSRYVMVIHYNTDEFTKRVNFYLERGYTLHGAPVTYNNRLTQILLKP